MSGSDQFTRTGGPGEPPSIPTSVFGEVLTAPLDPLINLSFLYSINPDLANVITNGAGTVTRVGNFAQVDSGPSAGDDAKYESKKLVGYRPGQGVDVRFTAKWSTPVQGTHTGVGIGNGNNGYMVGTFNEDFAILRRDNGVDNWTVRDDFNIDKLDGTGPSGMTINLAFGNVFKIQYQWLGFGEIDYQVENPDTGRFFTFHAIRYANSSPDTHSFIPSFPLSAEAVNTSGSGTMTVSVPSHAAFRQGTTKLSGNLYSTSNLKTVTTEENILTVRNDAVFNGLPNRNNVFPTILSMAATGTAAIIRIVENATLGGTPAFTPINANVSVMSVDTAGTTVTGGKPLYTGVIAGTGATNINLQDLFLETQPGSTLTIAATGVGSITALVGLSWAEEL